MRRTLLDAARAGDEEAFAQLVDPHRHQLYVHCVRMVGSAHDAEDALQDALFRAWRSLPTFAGRAPFRSWLYRIATNACLDVLEKRPKGVVPIDYETDGDVACDLGVHDEADGTEGGYERREAATLAATVVLHDLPAGQRAVLILREVLEVPAAEVASTLGTSVAAVNSALQRARAKVGTCDVHRGTHEGQLHDVAEGFVGALARGDVGTVIAAAADTAPSARRRWTYSPAPAYELCG